MGRRCGRARGRSDGWLCGCALGGAMGRRCGRARGRSRGCLRRCALGDALGWLRGCAGSVAQGGSRGRRGGEGFWGGASVDVGAAVETVAGWPAGEGFGVDWGVSVDAGVSAWWGVAAGGSAGQPIPCGGLRIRPCSFSAIRRRDSRTRSPPASSVLGSPRSTSGHNTHDSRRLGQFLDAELMNVPNLRAQGLQLPLGSRRVRPPRTRPSWPASGHPRRAAAGTSRPASQWRDRTRGDHVVRRTARGPQRRAVARDRVLARAVLEAELLHRLLQERGAPEQRLDERDLEVGAHQREHDPGQAGRRCRCRRPWTPPGSAARARRSSGGAGPSRRGTSRGPIRPRRVPSVASSSAYADKPTRRPGEELLHERRGFT